MTTTFKTIASAESYAARINSTMVKPALRENMVVVHGPANDYAVVTLGFAVVNEMQEVRFSRLFVNFQHE